MGETGRGDTAKDDQAKDDPGRSDLGDRMDRAGRYVLGLMDEDERERAERDLEVDSAFRDAILEIAARVHVFDDAPSRDASSGQPAGGQRQDVWRLVKEKIDAMPQMQAAKPAAPAEAGPPVTFGRRRTDRMRAATAAVAPAKTVGTGLDSIPGNRALVLALILAAAFALGYLAGIASAV